MTFDGPGEILPRDPDEIACEKLARNIASHYAADVYVVETEAEAEALLGQPTFAFGPVKIEITTALVTDEFWRNVWAETLCQASRVILPDDHPSWSVDLRKLLRRNRVAVFPFTPAEDAAFQRLMAAPPGLTFHDGDNITGGSTEWCWKGYIPLAGVTLVMSYPGGLGITTMLLTVCASVTRGVMPGDMFGDEQDVLIVGRDDVARVLLPRLQAVGAVRERLHFSNRSLSMGRGTEAARRDLEAITDMAYENGCGLVLIDGIDESNAEKLMPMLNEYAVASGQAVVVVVRGSKNERATTAVERIAGSGAIADQAASILAVIPDHYSTDERDRLLFVAKSRYEDDAGPGICFRVGGEPTVMTPLGLREVRRRDALARPGTSQRAFVWLAQHLHAQPDRTAVPAEVYAEAVTLGFSAHVIDVQREKLGVVTTSTNEFPARFRWTLPESAADRLRLILRKSLDTPQRQIEGSHLVSLPWANGALAGETQEQSDSVNDNSDMEKCSSSWSDPSIHGNETKWAPSLSGYGYSEGSGPTGQSGAADTPSTKTRRQWPCHVCGSLPTQRYPGGSFCDEHKPVNKPRKRGAAR
ncbi:MAG TPA: AAA family ATPase [Candidatus Limnocylindrales bacterium]|nr:AAA family ATPase [Candidatus Limnocylindrales bacterium]